MSQENDSTAGGFELRNFEKNRYFQGKLMSARDMVTDQQYHATRLETLTKLSTGTGILSGLEISEFNDRGDQLQVTIESGIAVDPRGRPIVVKNPTTRSVSKPDGGELHLYIEHDTETKDPVPVPGSEPMSEEKSEESRVLEVFSITARETLPDEQKPTPELDLPEFETAEMSLGEYAQQIATAYHDAHRGEIDPGIDTAVYLGSFEQNLEGEWEISSGIDRRPLVYDNDMLFAMLVSHLADTSDPHHTRDGDSTEYMASELDRMDELSIRLQEMQSEMSDLRDKLEYHNSYTIQKSLKSTVRFFDDLAAKYEQQTEISRLSLKIVESIRNRFTDTVHDDEEAYVSFVRVLLEDLKILAAELEGTVTPRSHRQFQDAVNSLDTAFDEEPSVVEIAAALDTVGEAADVLEKQTRVVPKGGLPYHNSGSDASTNDTNDAQSDPSGDTS